MRENVRKADLYREPSAYELGPRWYEYLWGVGITVLVCLAALYWLG